MSTTREDTLENLSEVILFSAWLQAMTMFSVQASDQFWSLAAGWSAVTVIVAAWLL
jgi:hypothetical protein